MVFSERHGFKKVRLDPQLESMDRDLRNGLWNVFLSGVLERARVVAYYRDFLRRIWTEYYKRPRDEFPVEYPTFFKQRFMEAPWHEVYDLVEITAASIVDTPAAFNGVLQRDNAGYRLIDGKVTPIIEGIEIDEVNAAIESGGGKYRLARDHVVRAIELFSDRENPDYRNSIKESISGAESAACVATAQKSFKDALRVLKERGLHPALAGVFNQLYGYTSDESGVRHALLDDPTVGPAEAHYMLVSCSAFISYLMQLK